MIFRNWVLENFPFLEDDFDALTDYELFCKMLEYVKQFAKDNEDFNKRLTDLENYINNLDLQDEVNNKLDEMASDGTLQEIVADYLNSKALFIFENVESMKESTNLIDGSYAKTLGFYTKGDRGGAIYIIRNKNDNETADNMVTFEINQDYIAEYIEGSGNIRKFGATGNGITDDAPFIRRAIAYLKERNQGNLFIPKGTYYISSGDPRGLNDGNHKYSDYWGCFEIIDNLSVIGEGEESIFLYNSNRLGYNLTTNRYDVGAVFTNMRVSGVDFYSVNGTITFKDFKVVYTDIEQESLNVRDTIDGQFVRITTSTVTPWTPEKNGNVIVENLNIENIPSHQVIVVTGGKSFTANNIIMHNFGKEVNTATTDFSGLFINAKYCNISNCKLYNDTLSDGTAFDIQSTFTNVIGNEVYKISQFMNCTGSALTQPKAIYNISNNIAVDIYSFVNGWIYTYTKIDTLNIHDNNVILLGDNININEYIFHTSTDEGSFSSSHLPIEQLIFKNNNCSTNITNTNNVNSPSDYSFKTRCIKNIDIENNNIHDFRRNFIDLSDIDNLPVFNNLIFNNNNFARCCLHNPTASVRRVFYFNITPYYTSDIQKKVIIKNNIINQSNISDTSCIMINANQGNSQQYTNTKFYVIDNELFAEDYLHELNVKMSGTGGTCPNCVTIKHQFKDTTVTLPVTLFSFNNRCDSINITSASEFRSLINGRECVIKVLYNNGSTTTWRVEGYASSSPIEGYYPKGSLLKNSTPSFTNESPYAWLCTASGNPSTWTPVNW
ncbi:MAG: hypothetical protein J6T10_21890 [Methanobrevibacter sp.]|nr:hypothetical protein [Methanobrevibacter sp.]